jgi:hypothetical protein
MRAMFHYRQWSQLFKIITYLRSRRFVYELIYYICLIRSMSLFYPGHVMMSENCLVGLIYWIDHASVGLIRYLLVLLL